MRRLKIDLRKNSQADFCKTYIFEISRIFHIGNHPQTPRTQNTNKSALALGLFIPGTIMGDVPFTPKLLRNAGDYLGRLSDP